MYTTRYYITNTAYAHLIYIQSNNVNYEDINGTFGTILQYRYITIFKWRVFVILDLLYYKNTPNVILTGKIQGQTSRVLGVAMDPRKNKSFEFKGFNGLELGHGERGACQVETSATRISNFYTTRSTELHQKKPVILLVKLISN